MRKEPDVTRSPSPRDDIGMLVEAIDALPAVVHDRHLTVIGANRLASAVCPAFAVGVNFARSAFLDESVPHAEPSWPALAEHVAASLRLALDRHEADEEFRLVVGELSAQSRQFSAVFADESAVQHGSGTWVFRLEGRPPMTLAFHRLAVPGADDDTLLVWRPADPESGRMLAEVAAGLPR